MRDTNGTPILTTAFMDSLGRFVGNIGVPAAIAFLVLWQLTPKLDQLVAIQTTTNTEIIALGVSCGGPRSPAVMP